MKINANFFPSGPGNFDFLGPLWPHWAKNLNQAYEYLFADPQSSICKTGSCAEDITREISRREGCTPKPWCRFWDYLQDLLHKLPIEIWRDLDYIRDRCNRAKHKSLATEWDASQCLSRIHRVLVWMFEEYQLGTTTDYVPPYDYYRPFAG